MVLTEVLREDGSWSFTGMRPATPIEIQNQKADEPMPTKKKKAEPARSGSHNTHARLAPSGSKQWTNCTISPAYIEANKSRVPEDTGSRYATEGTDAHDEAADVLTGRKDILDVPGEFRGPVGEYCTHCTDLIPDGTTPMVEVEVPLFYQTDRTGTCDFALASDDKVIVRDYKHGAGVLVTSEDNTQLAIYCMSLVRNLEDVYSFHPGTVIDIAVFQPRHREGAGQTPWILSLADLEAFCAEIGARAREARQAVEDVRHVDWKGHASCADIAAKCPAARFAPSEGDGGACRWCPAKAFCEMRLAEMLKGIPGADPKAMLAAMPDLSKEEKKLEPGGRVEARTDGIANMPPLDDAFLVAMFAAAKGLAAFGKDVAEYLEGRVLAGESIPGLKLVMGREGNRAWGNEVEAETFLKGQKLKMDERFKFVLKSPTQIEALLKDKLEKSARTAGRFKTLVTRSPAKKVIALEGDRREAVVASVDVMPDMDGEGFEI